MKRLIEPLIQRDLLKKMVFLSGPRQAGKTTLAQTIAKQWRRPQSLNWDVLTDQRIIRNQSWPADADLLVFDELHKMVDWRSWLKGVVDSRSRGQTIMVTGSARLDSFRQAGESLAGRYFAWHLYPVTVQELVTVQGQDPDLALSLLLERGGFPEPLLTDEGRDALRWRQLYLDGLIREDIIEFSRIAEVRAMRLFVDMLRERVGSTISLASMARDLQVSSVTLNRYLGILESLHIVFLVRPYRRNIARAILKEPKVYFFDTGLVLGDEGARFENACAVMLFTHIQLLQDSEGRVLSLNYIRDKDQREIDFAISESQQLLELIECKWANVGTPSYLAALSNRFPQARATLLLRHLRQREQRERVSVEPAAAWLAEPPTWR